MTDLELLELAAKAAGIDWFDEPAAKRGRGLNLKSGPFWNPLEDDGDALRLAVKIKLNVNVEHTSIDVYAPNLQLTRVWATEIDDAYVATRRAIVRAAAEIGRGNK